MSFPQQPGSSPQGFGGGPQGWGSPPPVGAPYQQPGPPKPTPTEAIIALVLSIATMMTTCFPLGFVGMYFGHKARKKGIEEGDKTQEILGLISLIMGAAFGAIWLLFWIVQIVLPLGVIGMIAATEGLNNGGY